MFATDLICSNGHKFEACFSNRAAFELQKKEELIECPRCGDTSVKQVLSAVRIKKHSEGEKPRPKRSGILALIDKNFEDVGQKFAEEAIKIHHGESKKRNIKGTATEKEEKELAEEGVPFVKIPDIQ